MSQDVPWAGIPWWVWGLACLAVALVYAFLDAPVTPGGGFFGWLARWGHSVCWVLLAASFFVRLGPPGPWANGLAVAAGLVYLAFLVRVLR